MSIEHTGRLNALRGASALMARTLLAELVRRRVLPPESGAEIMFTLAETLRNAGDGAASVAERPATDERLPRAAREEFYALAAELEHIAPGLGRRP